VSIHSHHPPIGSTRDHHIREEDALGGEKHSIRATDSYDCTTISDCFTRVLYLVDPPIRREGQRREIVLEGMEKVREFNRSIERIEILFHIKDEAVNSRCRYACW
jgi:hypothetical protein